MSLVTNSQNEHLCGSFHGLLMHSEEPNMLDHETITTAQNPQLEMAKTLSMDRTNDNVYSATTNVVKAVMLLSQGVERAAAVEYLDLVRYVGIELRTLLSSVDTLASIFPPQALKYVVWNFEN